MTEHDSAAFAPRAAELAAWPPRIEETHISVLVMMGDRVFKLKKPIELPFLDWRSPDTRLEMCRREVELNRRICPDVYLGVATVSDESGRPYDHLVVMRRMPEQRRLSRLVRDGASLHGELDRLADLVATFHAGATRTAFAARSASRDEVARNWRDNLMVLRDHEGDGLDAGVVARVDQLARTYLAGRLPLFDERAATGHAVDGHGDLLADDIYLLEDGPRVLDCLEFCDRLRAVDVLDDVAFLVMDLEDLGAAELGRHFLDSYRRHSGDRHPASLVHHFVAYRASVRSKVACVRSDQGDTGAGAHARRLLDLARTHLECGATRLVLVGGLPGTGKSSLAAELGQRTGWGVLRSDVVRKELLGVTPSARHAAAHGEGIYSAHHTRATYRELLTRARHDLERGESVIVDASWIDQRRRDEAAVVARETASELVALRCDAPPELAAGRLVRRGPGEASDATPAIARAMAAVADPWPSAQRVDTAVPIDESIAAAMEAIGPFELDPDRPPLLPT
jgi:uncharacterized protein